MQIERRRAFVDVLVETVDTVLIDIFGKIGANIVKQQLRTKYLLDFNLNSLDIERFNFGITELLGSGGDMVLKTIIKYMKKVLEIDSGIVEQDFVKQLQGLEKKYSVSKPQS